jgi:hypothetical protein
VTKFNEHPKAGEEWVAKAALLGATLRMDYAYGYFMLWAAKLPDSEREFYGVTQARACRKLVRSITGVE